MSNKNHKHQIEIQETYQAPLPHPEHMQKYVDMYPNAANFFFE
ncbi:hypothetical protein [Fangia hongkongensis]|nr:hypothetical protein [Fangia hongkongensis]